MKKIPKGKKNKIKFPCDICKDPEYLEEHHIRGRKIPNCNHQSNLCNICTRCHQELHMGDLIIEDWVMTSSGRELMFHKKGEESFTGEKAKVHIFGKDLKLK